MNLLQDYVNFKNNRLDQVRDPSGVMKKVLGLDGENINEYISRRGYWDGTNQNRVNVEFQFKTKEDAVLFMKEVKTAMSLLKRIKDIAEETLSTTLKGPEDARMVFTRRGEGRGEELHLSDIYGSVNLRNFEIYADEDYMSQSFFIRPRDKQTILDPISLSSGLSARKFLDYVDECRSWEPFEKDLHFSDALKKFADEMPVSGNEIEESYRLLDDVMHEEGYTQKAIERMIKDDLRVSIDVDVVLSAEYSIGKLVNPPKWAKELPPAAALTAFDALRFVTDKDLEKLNSPEEQERYVSALKNATRRHGGLGYLDTVYSMAEFFYPECSQSVADTYVYGVRNMSTASHPHMIDTSLRTDEQLKAEIEKMKDIKSAKIISGNQKFPISPTYKRLEKEGFTLVKTVANLNGIRKQTGRDLSEYAPKLTKKDVCIAVSREKGNECACVIKWNNGKYEITESCGVTDGISKLSDKLNAVNTLMEKEKKERGPSIKAPYAFNLKSENDITWNVKNRTRPRSKDPDSSIPRF